MELEQGRKRAFVGHKIGALRLFAMFARAPGFQHAPVDHLKADRRPKRAGGRDACVHNAYTTRRRRVEFRRVWEDSKFADRAQRSDSAAAEKLDVAMMDPDPNLAGAGRAGVTTFIFTCVNCVTRKARPQVS